MKKGFNNAVDEDMEDSAFDDENYGEDEFNAAELDE